jgi:hypothetical protein
MATKRLKRPRDPIQLGKLIVDIATGQVEDRVEDDRDSRAVAIHFMHYNFVRTHQSLRMTPAMAAGVTTKLWEMEDMVRVIEDWEAAQAAAHEAKRAAMSEMLVG